MLDGMTNIKASEVLKEIKYYTEDLPPYSPDEVAEALDMAIKALKLQPCEDCVSREAVIRLVEQYPNIIGNRCSGLISDIKHLPSVTPERPKGKWMECGGDEPWLKGYCCSLCNFTATNKYNYCPDCGAEMGGADETN